MTNRFHHVVYIPITHLTPASLKRPCWLQPDFSAILINVLFIQNLGADKGRFFLLFFTSMIFMRTFFLL